MVKKIEIDLSDLNVTINNKIHDYIYKYNNRPKYIKIPIWVLEALKSLIKDLPTFYIDYETEHYIYNNLIVCETLSIQHLDEMEVF